MGGDAAITDVGTEIRDRQYQLKIVPSPDGRALQGVAGDAHPGSKIIQQAARLPAGETVTFLLESHRENPSVDLAMDTWMTPGHTSCGFRRATRENCRPSISATPTPLNIFNALGTMPKIHQYPEQCQVSFPVQGIRIQCRKGLNTAITSMPLLFAARSERDVGWWPTAHSITSGKAFFVDYR